MMNKFKEGEVVIAMVNPALKLIVRRYVDRIYYCKIQEDPVRKELVYYERELMADKTIPADERLKIPRQFITSSSYRLKFPGDLRPT